MPGELRNERLAAVMKEADCSAKRLARLVRQTGARNQEQLGTDHTTIGRWLSGAVRAPRTASYAAEALGQILGRTVTLEDIGFPHSEDLTNDIGQHYPETITEAAATLMRLWRADLGDAKVLEAPPYGHIWDAVPLAWLLTPASADISVSNIGQRIGIADVQAFKANADVFAQLDNTYGGGRARRALIEYLDSTLRPLLHGSYTEATGRELYGATAEASLLTAWTCYDTGRHGLAQRYFVPALYLAQTGSDQRLTASILSAMSHQATFLGRYREAARLARAALMGCPTASNTQISQLLAMEARAHARLGDATACDAALSKAIAAFERRNTDDDPAFISYFDERELNAEIGHCARDLGRAQDAATYALQSLGNSCGARSDFFVTMVLPDAYLQQGEPEQACKTALIALKNGERLASTRCVAYVREFRRELESLDNLITKEFVTQAADSTLWQKAAA